MCIGIISVDRVVGVFFVADAAISANGFTFKIFENATGGGSSGGTIILESKKVMACLELPWRWLDPFT